VAPEVSCGAAAVAAAASHKWLAVMLFGSVITSTFKISTFYHI
jgi:hypothetical protein